jgi:hypothetical protein
VVFIHFNINHLMPPHSSCVKSVQLCYQTERFYTLAYLLQFNNLRTQHSALSTQHSALAHCTTKNVLNPYTFFCSFVHLLFCVTRLPNCAYCSISASNSPSSAALRTLASTSATSASLASSMAFLPLANSNGLLP